MVSQREALWRLFENYCHRPTPLTLDENTFDLDLHQSEIVVPRFWRNLGRGQHKRYATAFLLQLASLRYSTTYHFLDAQLLKLDGFGLPLSLGLLLRMLRHDTTSLGTSSPFGEDDRLGVIPRE